MKQYLKINNKKIEFKTQTTIKDKIMSFRFYLQPIKTGLCYKNKKMINTYFFCQKIDIIIADKNNTIIALYKNVKTEKIIRPRLKAYYIYLLPNNTTEKLKIGDNLTII